ncbi:PucR family transcriptional regulator [Intrasporangium calvum]|uniref:Transcriptional regulator, PucR family n=1 Tax=Intrasporangium calvum (strain ATCC 23552 / DSM 43043 / JCM 3097 / NBRC 12989 / NCIMB 10167 / NRRL B-3866 / 7 KIP) TaxID=710696 RepID=E6SBI9_INTC7|nr:helix-turn-helix domain-containing protein [Intrasporangium calvum]ADU49517.1 putative transcriptional regulator, PucR family [Intrasporangium calvum DSM 43043]
MSRQAARAGALTMRQLLDALGEVMARPLDSDQPLDRVVTDVVIHDPLSPQALEEGDLVLAVGVAPDGNDAISLIDAAELAGAAGVAFRRAGGVPRLPGGSRAAVILVDPDLAWEQLISFGRGLVFSAAAGSASDDEQPSDLFSLANTIADLVVGSVVLYDVHHQVLAYSSLDGHVDALDEVRKGTILGRRTPDDWVDRFERDGVYDRRPGARVMRIEGYADLRTRLRVAVRAGDEVVGEISVAETTARLGPQTEAVLEQAARLAAPHLVRHRLERDLTRRARSSALQALLAGRGPLDVHRRELDLPLTSSYAVIGLALHPAAGPGTEAEIRRERSARLVGALTETQHPRAVTCRIGSTVYALLPHPPSSDRLRLLTRHVVARAAVSGVPVRGAVGRTVTSLGDVALSRAEVDQVLRVLSAADPEGGGEPDLSGTPLVAGVDDVWADIALVEVRDLLDEAGARRPSRPISVLLTHDADRGTAYVPTLTAYLDAFGDVRAAAKALALHPNSLRHRLRRLSQIAGLDLDDPVQRLVVALELRILL